MTKRYQRQEAIDRIGTEEHRMPERYQRQEAIDRIGTGGQRRLARARVTVAGAGGLGSPVLTYLAQAGVGTLRLIDFDTVSLSNLNRQFLYTENDLGRKKADAAKERLELLNSEIRVEALDAKLTEENAEKLIGHADVVVNCLDSISARLLAEEVCIRKRIPLVEGGISGFFGFVMCVGGDGPCLECLGYDRSMDRSEGCQDSDRSMNRGTERRKGDRLPDRPEGCQDSDRPINRITERRNGDRLLDRPVESVGGDRLPDQETAVPALGAVAGVIGSLQAVECLKILLGTDGPRYGRMLQYDGISGTLEEVLVKRKEDCQLHRRAEAGVEVRRRSEKETCRGQ